MPTIGHRNDALRMLVPVGVAVVVGVILFGRPSEAVEAINNALRDIAEEAMTLASTWL